MVKRQPSWFWVLRAWLSCRKSILSCCLPTGGADRRVCAWMRPAVRSRFWEMKNHYWLSGGLSNLQPLLSHYLCSVENSFLSIVYQESWIRWQIDRRICGRLEYHPYCLWQLVLLFSYFWEFLWIMEAAFSVSSSAPLHTSDAHS